MFWLKSINPKINISFNKNNESSEKNKRHWFSYGYKGYNPYIHKYCLESTLKSIRNNHSLVEIERMNRNRNICEKTSSEYVQLIPSGIFFMYFSSCASYMTYLVFHKFLYVSNLSV